MSNRARIFAYGRSILLTFQTNAAWRQRVKITGPDFTGTVEGSGERKIHWQRWTHAGAWEIEHWYLRPGGGWEPGVARRIAPWQVGFDDGAGDGDFQDTLVTATVVIKSALASAEEFRMSVPDDLTDERFEITGPDDEPTSVT